MKTSYKYKAKCVRVIDGDTMVFKVDLGFHLKNEIYVRLQDIDTPEIFGPDAKEEGELGKAVKEFVTNLLFKRADESFTNKDNQEVLVTHAVYVTLETVKTGSFGRWLGVVTFEDGETLSGKIRRKFPEIK